MINSLYIKNIAVIKELSVDLSGGLTTLTGETGAGKSVIIDSIGILLGSRPHKEKIRNGEASATVSACFDGLSEDTLRALDELGFDGREGVVIQRTVTREGKTSVKVNGQTVTQAMGKQIGAHLMTIHGQNDNQKLMQRSEHMGILDSYAELSESKNEYFKVYSEYKATRERLDSIKKSAAESARMLDVYKFQAREIDEAALRSGEEERLEAEEKRLENIEKIEKHSRFAYHVLRGSEKSVSVLVDKASASLEQLSSVINEAQELAERLARVGYELDDIAEAVRELVGDDVQGADKRLDKIGSRLDLIQKLKRKYGENIDEILKFRKSIGERIDEMENSDELIERTEKELKELLTRLSEKGRMLTEKRKAAAKRLQDDIMRELSFLEMPKVRFVVDVKCGESPTPNGFDEVEFLISTNAGNEPMPMIKIASGGELSRIMLAIKTVLLDKDGVDSVIFDEIDTGISGKTSRKVGIKLKEIAKKIQVLCVTHSAQIASLADGHLLISKRECDGETQTSVRLLDEEGRVNEVARILGGLNITRSQTDAAREMIEEGKYL